MKKGIEKNQEILLKKIVWEMYRRNKIPFEDLYGEAILAYFESLQKWNNNEVTQKSFTISVVRNHLINFCMKQSAHKNLQNEFQITMEIMSFQTHWFEIYDSFSPTGKKMIEIILENKELFFGLPPKLAKGVLQKLLRQKYQWKFEDIWRAMKEGKKIMSQTPENPTKVVKYSIKEEIF